MDVTSKTRIPALLAALLPALLPMPVQAVGEHDIFFMHDEPGLGFYAGAHLGGYNLNPVRGESSNGGLYGVQFGIEDGRWSAEARLFQLRTTEDVQDKTSDLMASLALVYRRHVSYDNYIKLKAGWLRYDDANLDNGDLIGGAGFGWRLQSGNRLELEYEYSYQDLADGSGAVDFAVHMLSLQYLFGGSPESRY